MTRISTFLLLLHYLLAAVVSADAAEPTKPLIVAHRGLLRHAPENTLANDAKAVIGSPSHCPSRTDLKLITHDVNPRSGSATTVSLLFRNEVTQVTATLSERGLSRFQGIFIGPVLYFNTNRTVISSICEV